MSTQTASIELTLSRCQNPRSIACEFTTMQSRAWVERFARFDASPFIPDAIQGRAVLQIAPEHDFEAVLAQMAGAPFVKVADS